jgi:peptidoglycan/xylan/chitin deacetylase (PgdA/CDA1 family)
MYHRVADPAVDPWGLSVSADQFKSQMEALAASRPVLPLEDFVRRHTEGDLPRNAVAITFDDGYRDNALVAAPILQRLNLPATVFIATGAIGSEREYWWDELARLILLGQQPLRADLRLPDGPLEVVIDGGADPAAARLWRASDEQSSPRLRQYLAVWRRLRTLEPELIEEALATLRRAAAAPDPSPSDLPMSRAEAMTMIASGHIRIYPHTVGHVALTSVTRDRARREIVESMAYCAELTGRTITGFAYPYGDNNRAARALLAEAGISWACSTRSRRLRVREPDLFDLPRRLPSYGNGEQLLARLT